jgi:hypothetical protein
MLPLGLSEKRRFTSVAWISAGAGRSPVKQRTRCRRKSCPFCLPWSRSSLPEPLSIHEADDQGPAWSPDGKELVSLCRFR